MIGIILLRVGKEVAESASAGSMPKRKTAEDSI